MDNKNYECCLRRIKMKLEDLLKQSKLDEAKKNHEGAEIAFGTGYFVDPSGKLYDIGEKITHEGWANKRGQTVNDLIDRGWTRMRNFNSSTMNYVQGDSNNINNIWYLIDLADHVGKNRIIFWVGRHRFDLSKRDGKWESDNGRGIEELTESKLRTTSPIFA